VLCACNPSLNLRWVFETRIHIEVNQPLKERGEGFRIIIQYEIFDFFHRCAMPPGRPPIDDLLKLRIGLSLVSGRDQKETANALGVSQASVSRTVDWLKRRGWIQWEPTVNAEAIDKDLYETARAMVDASKPLADRINDLWDRDLLPHPISVSVFSSKPPKDWQPSVQDDRPLAYFASAAAPTIWNLVSKVRGYCGLTWGRSLGALVAAFERTPKGYYPPTQLQVVPLCGDAIGQESASLNSSSALAQRLASVLNQDERPQKSLALLPAFVPSDFSRSEEKVIRKLIERIQAYREIFGDQANAEGLYRSTRHVAATLDAIVTGISRTGAPYGFGQHGFFGPDGRYTAKEISKSVLADLGEVLLAREGVVERTDRVIRNLRRRWTGLQMSALEACAHRAVEPNVNTNRPGVILFAIGKDKAEPIVTAMKRGLLNHLIVDKDLAEAIVQFRILPK
jgi:DNA-binding transcriptional regulator LsrR (DeoR family)